MGGTQVVEKGNAIILECNATGGDYPPEDVDWFKDGQKINADAASKIDITKYVSIASKMLFSKLYIKHSRMEDAGIYLCRSSGKNVKFLNVNVLNGKHMYSKAVTAISFTRSIKDSGFHGKKKGIYYFRNN